MLIVRFDYVEDQRVPRRLLCSTCNFLIREPVTFVCDHVFCEDCIRPQMRQKHTACPVCFRLSKMAADPKTLACLGELRVHCSYKAHGCGWQGQRSALAQHVFTCAHTPCTYAQRGCAFVGTSAALSRHLLSCPSKPSAAFTLGDPVTASLSSPSQPPPPTQFSFASVSSVPAFALGERFAPPPAPAPFAAPCVALGTFTGFASSSSAATATTSAAPGASLPAVASVVPSGTKGAAQPLVPLSFASLSLPTFGTFSSPSSSVAPALPASWSAQAPPVNARPRAGPSFRHRRLLDPDSEATLPPCAILSTFDIGVPHHPTDVPSIASLPIDLLAYALEFVRILPRLIVLRRVCRRWNNAITLAVRRSPDDLINLCVQLSAELRIDSLAPLCARVQSLCAGRDMTAKAAGLFSALTSLDCSTASDAVANILVLRNAASLTCLSLCPDFRPSAFFVPHFPALRTLSVVGSCVPPAANTLTQLTRLVISTWHSFIADVHPASAHRHLRTLQIAIPVNNDVDGICRWIAALPALASLSLDARNVSSSEAVWTLLAKTTCLTKLSVNIPDTQRLSQALAPHTKLRALMLGSAPFTETLLQVVGSRLRHLTLHASESLVARYCTDLESVTLNFEPPPLFLRGWPLARLRRLTLSNNSRFDAQLNAVLEAAAHCPNLECAHVPWGWPGLAKAYASSPLWHSPSLAVCKHSSCSPLSVTSILGSRSPSRSRRSLSGRER